MQIHLKLYKITLNVPKKPGKLQDLLFHVLKPIKILYS